MMGKRSLSEREKQRMESVLRMNTVKFSVMASSALLSAILRERDRNSAETDTGLGVVIGDCCIDVTLSIDKVIKKENGEYEIQAVTTRVGRDDTPISEKRPMSLSEAVAVYDRATAGSSGCFKDAWEILREEVLSPGFVKQSVDDYKKMLYLIGSIFYYGNFKVETPAERELKTLLVKRGFFFETENQLMNKREELTKAGVDLDPCKHESTHPDLKRGVRVCDKCGASRGVLGPKSLLKIPDHL